MSTKTKQEPTTTHIFFLLDRSGSMGDIANDVIGGFNSYVESQVDGPDEAQMTLVQFDTQGPHEVMFASTFMKDVPKLSRENYQPRGGTPLYDAMGHLITDANIWVEQIHAEGKFKPEVIFITFTDGYENSSREYTREGIFQLIQRKQDDDGWAFVYMGANQDAYDAGRQSGFERDSTSNFRADARGTALAFRDLSTGTTQNRMKRSSGRRVEKGEFFEGVKTADQDSQERA